MKSLVQFWQALDEIPHATTARREWSLRLGGDLPAAASYLKSTGLRAREIACPSPGGEGCPRKVVTHRGGRHRAVCGNNPAECDAIDVTGDEITCLTLDRRKLAAAIGSILDAAVHQPGDGTFVGTHAVAAGIGVPVVLAIPGPMSDAMPRILQGLHEPTAVVIPTQRSLSRPCLGELKSAGHLVLTLSEIAGTDLKDRLIPLRPATEWLAPLRDRLLANYSVPTSNCIWLLPPETRWEDLLFDFTDRERVIVRCRDQTRSFEPAQFGMRNAKSGKPTLQWTLLRLVTRNDGRLTWNQPRDRPRVEKQKQLLSKDLRRLFGIQDDPLPWDRDQQVYVARFRVRFSIPKGADQR